MTTGRRMLARSIALVALQGPALAVAAPERPGESPAAAPPVVRGEPEAPAVPASETAAAPEAALVSADEVAAVGDASRLIVLSLLATAVGHADLARLAAIRALELAPADADAHRALALVHRAAGEHSLARAQVGGCRTAAGQDEAACAALEAALAAGDPAARLALRIALERSAAETPAPAASNTPVTSSRHTLVEEAERAFEQVALRCVEVANWNYVLVGIELGSEAGPPDRVRILSPELDEPLERCIERELESAEFSLVPYHLGRAYYGRIDFEETGRLRPRWIWRIVPRALLYALTVPGEDRALLVARAGMAVIDRPFLQPTVHLDAEIGSSRGDREYEVSARGGVGFARSRFSAGLTAGLGVGAVAERAPAALVVPVELWLEYRAEGAGIELWARNTSSPAVERIRGSEHAVLGSTALTLGAGLRVPVLWRGGIAVGVRYDERLGEQLLGFWLGTELRR